MIVSEEYKEVIKDIRKEADAKIIKVLLGVANDMNKVNIGDTITDRHHTIEVDYIGTYCDVDTRRISITYKGVDLKKDGTPRKDQKDGYMFESNIKFHNNKPYVRL